MRKLRNLANIGLATLLAVSFTAVPAFAEDNVYRTLDEIREKLLEVMDGEDQDKYEFDAVRECADGSGVLLHNVVQKVSFENEIDYLQHLYIPIEDE